MAFDDADPKEVTLYHAAGLDGRGGSSKLDSVIARYRHDDGNTSTSPAEEWADAAGTLGSRGIYFQNWRGDIVGHYERGILERVRYTPYGRPMGFVDADQDQDGDDVTAWSGYLSSGNARGDVNFDGRLNGSDWSALSVANARCPAQSPVRVINASCKNNTEALMRSVDTFWYSCTY